MDPGKRLSRGEHAAREGRYEEALDDFIWFHEHALEHDPAYYGVRLSFAISSWLELGENYPSALTALRKIRDRKVQQLLAGLGDRDLFHDVESINEHLEEDRGTYELFIKLNAQSPQLATACAGIAMAALIKSRDYRLARAFIADPAQQIRRSGENLNEDLARLASKPPSPAPMKETFIQNYAEYVSQILEVLASVGELEEAQALKKLAIESVETADIREAVQIALSRTHEI